MKIKFKQKYISIEEFESIDVNDFTILTGKNGSGKTHFLNAIKQGSIEIEGIQKSEIVYYNYNDFTVFSGNLQQNVQYKNKSSTWLNEKQEYLNKIQLLKSKAIQLVAYEQKSLDQILFNFTQQASFDFNNYFGNKNDYILLDNFKRDENILFQLNEKVNLFTPYFYSFIRQYITLENADIKEINYENLKLKFENQKKNIEQILIEEDKDFYNFLKNTIQNKSILNLNENDFESPNLFLEDIANEEKEYQFKKTQNILNKARYEEYNEKISYLDADKFIQKNGLSPIELINNVLTEYDCNGYYLNTNPNQQFLGVDKNTIKIQINLKHKEKGYSTSFEQLSSGEKTLIALSLFIYKTRKNRVIPRVLLLDEVDSSLHPSMINRLLNVFQNLFIKEQGFKIIMATHSPTTVALSPDESIYILEKNHNQIIKKEIKSNAIKILTEGIATLNEEDTNFGINYNLSKTELPILFTEGITDKIILETAWKKINNTEKMPFYIQDCFDASFLGNLFRRAEDTKDGLFSNYPDKTFIALFDFDYEGYNVWNNLKNKYEIIDDNPKNSLTIKHLNKKAYALLLPVPENEDIIKQVIKSGNETYKNDSILSIELMFYGIETLNIFFKREKIKGGGEIIEFKGNKREFANKLMELNKEDFENLIPLFKKIQNLIK